MVMLLCLCELKMEVMCSRMIRLEGEGDGGEWVENDVYNGR